MKTFNKNTIWMSNLHKLKFLKFNNIDGNIFLSLFVKKQKMPEIFYIYINYDNSWNFNEMLHDCKYFLNDNSM